MTNKRFHLALNTNQLSKTAQFYKTIFDIEMKTVDNHAYFDFFGTIIAFYEQVHFEVANNLRLTDKEIIKAQTENFIPVFHFGTFELELDELLNIMNRVRNLNSKVIIGETICNKGTEEEQMFAFIEDPNGYIIELRTITNNFSSVKKITDYMQQRDDFIKETLN
ncbi:MAG: VOC family protein [Sphingobacteriia bacterium]|nr:VOC family protein [Sphingobacteriia bacterium]